MHLKNRPIERRGAETTARHSRKQRNADSFVRATTPAKPQHADKAVRSPEEFSRCGRILTDSSAESRRVLFSQRPSPFGDLLPFRALIVLALCGLFGFIATPISKADTTWNYAVMISATVQSAPPQIALAWPQDDYGAIRYTVYRKAKEATSWGTGTVLPGTTTNYTDSNVAVGGTYEYQIVKDATLGYKVTATSSAAFKRRWSKLAASWF